MIKYVYLFHSNIESHVHGFKELGNEPFVIHGHNMTSSGRSLLKFFYEGNEKLKVQRSEIEDARWFKPDAALNLLEYKGAREMLAKAIKVYKAQEEQCSG